MTAANRAPDAKWIYKTIGGKPLQMHVFLPPDYDDSDARRRRTKSKSYPTFVIFHGGSWREGTVEWHYADCRHWSTTRGCIAISVDYRLKNQDDANLEVPLECIKDAKSAIRYLRSNAMTLKVDPNKIVVMGDSAGGQMAASTAIISSANTNHDDDDTSISCVPNAIILTNPFFKMKEEMGRNAQVFCPKELCPPLHIRSNLPPIITFVGTNDKIVPFESLIKFHELLEENGNVSELYIGEGGGHGFCNGSNPMKRFFYWSVELEDAFLVANKILPPGVDGTQIKRPQGVQPIKEDEYEAYRSKPKPPTNKFDHTIVSSEEPKRRSRFRALRDSVKSKFQEVASDMEDSLKDYASDIATDLRQSAVGDAALNIVDTVADKVGEKHPECRISNVLQGAQSFIVDTDNRLIPARQRAYTHSYWANCWRRYGIDKSPDILCLESGYYGLSLNVAKLTTASYKALDDDNLSYADVISFQNRGRMDGLTAMDLVIEVQVDDKTYRAQTARPAKGPAMPHLCNGRLWEAGRIAQHYQLIGIVLKDLEQGGSGGDSATLECNASLYLVAWPEEFAITLELSPLKESTWQDGATVRLELGEWSTQQPFSGPWFSNQTEEVTLACNVTKSTSSNSKLQDVLKVSAKNESATPPQVFTAQFDPHFCCFNAEIMNPKRNFARGYTDIRDADVFSVEIENSSEENVYVPILFHVKPAANITGLVPMLWIPQEDASISSKDETFVPSGIPIQCSKNWHYVPLGNYLRAFALIPATPGLQSLQFRIYYGFYGNLCSASHANLSLVGWPKYSEFSTAGRWEQMAIGCFGETFCLDIEMSATTQTITDVRALMVRQGVSGKKWSWTNAGWGGDWLAVYNKGGRKFLLGGVKAAYLSQGPCLTEVRYTGYYGINAEVYLNATVHTSRTNDYARATQKLRYDFNTTVTFTNIPNTAGSCLFRVGGAAGWEGWVCSKVCLGNANGLIEEVEVPRTSKVKEFLVDRAPLTGPGPWWIGFPDSEFTNKAKRGAMGVAWKALIVRSFESNIGGQVATSPFISLYVRQKQGGDSGCYVDALITPSKGFNEFNKGDFVTLEVEWVTIPYSASDYYGDNQTFKNHLQENPKSWKTIHREAVGNNLSVDIKGGKVKSTYPLIIDTSAASTIELKVTGGIGAVPIRFEGLGSTNYKLHDGSGVVCDELYEAAYDHQCSKYSMAFNLLLDEKPTSSWTLESNK